MPAKKKIRKQPKRNSVKAAKKARAVKKKIVKTELEKRIEQHGTVNDITTGRIKS